MKPPAHIVISAGAALLVGQGFQSTGAGWACFFSGVFIDIDHLFDYLLRSPHRKLSVRDFFHPDQWGPDGKLYLIFHGWEYLPLLLLASLIPGITEIAWGIFIGVFIHLILDHIHNNGHPLTYFVIYRWKSAFHFHRLFNLPLKGQDE
ncbi:hypothetical protein ACFL27_07215 [candidate division CSSED10-310 bacterium]|uniref:Metal-dependent hydrolase n=1 Tax=candidate division CSSED10-310 bacterium TaxID=2855610 RepID=A0ABV6YUU4_UNCC1